MVTAVVKRTARLADQPTDLTVLVRERNSRSRAEASRNTDTAPAANDAGSTVAPRAEGRPLPDKDDGRAAPPEQHDAVAPDGPPPPPPAAVAPPAPPRARGLGLNAFFAIVALGAAAVALTAPSLRPVLVQQVPALLPDGFGDASTRLAELLTPESQADRDIAALLPRVAGLESELLRLRLEIRQLDRRLAESGALGRENQQAVADIAALTAETARRVERMDSAGQVLTARVRAAAVLAAATRLRRDLDTGTALAEGVALMDLNAPYPEPVARAVETLRGMPNGVTTIRDLAIAYETLDQSIAASLGQDGSGWSRLRALFGGEEDPRLSFLQRVRQMATEGRMTEVATLLAHSPWQAEAAPWIARARERTEATRAAQTISAYAVAEARASLAAPADTATRPRPEAR